MEPLTGAFIATTIFNALAWMYTWRRLTDTKKKLSGMKADRDRWKSACKSQEVYTEEIQNRLYKEVSEKVDTKAALYKAEQELLQLKSKRDAKTGRFTKKQPAK